MLNIKYKIFLFDFDGVIIDSNNVREYGFKIVLNKYPDNKIQKLLKYHNENGGLSRYNKFRYFYEVILGKSITEKKIHNYAAEFSKIMLNELPQNKYLIDDVVKYIDKLFKENKALHIVSGSDQTELRIITKKLKISHYFKSILGSPTHKNTLVDEVINLYNYPLKEICLIGDSINDYEAAKINNIDFFGYNNLDLAKKKNYIKSFKEL